MRVHVSWSGNIGYNSFYFELFRFYTNWNSYKGHPPYIQIGIFSLDIIICFGNGAKKECPGNEQMICDHCQKLIPRGDCKIILSTPRNFYYHYKCWQELLREQNK